MKALVVRDSTHGNTEKIAQAVGQGIGCPLRRVGEIRPAEMKGLDLLILGSPTHGGFPTPEMDSLLKVSPALEGANVAVFDTRTKTTVFGYAGPRMAKRLKGSGGNLVAPPEGFLVLGIEGSLKDGELERAARRARGMSEKLRQPDGR